MTFRQLRRSACSGPTTWSLVSTFRSMTTFRPFGEGVSEMICCLGDVKGSEGGILDYSPFVHISLDMQSHGLLVSHGLTENWNPRGFPVVKHKFLLSCQVTAEGGTGKEKPIASFQEACGLSAQQFTGSSLTWSKKHCVHRHICWLLWRGRQEPGSLLQDGWLVCWLLGYFVYLCLLYFFVLLCFGLLCFDKCLPFCLQLYMM